MPTREVEITFRKRKRAAFRAEWCSTIKLEAIDVAGNSTIFDPVDFEIQDGGMQRSIGGRSGQRAALPLRISGRRAACHEIRIMDGHDRDAVEAPKDRPIEAEANLLFAENLANCIFLSSERPRKARCGFDKR